MAGLSVVLVLDNLDLDEEIFLSKWAIRGTGGLATFLVVLLLSWFVMPAVNESGIRRGPILLKYITGISHYPVLALAEKFTPGELNKALKIDGTPLIYTNSPVYETIERFISESGNQKTVAQQSEEYSLHYALNQGDRTTEADTKYLAKGESTYSQNKKDFYNDTVKYEGETEGFQYAPLYMPFQESSSNADWTSVVDISDPVSPAVGSILQYPKLSDLKNYAIKDDSAYTTNPELNDRWIKKLIEANSENRGFIAYQYFFIKNLSDDGLISQCDINPVRRFAPTPYLRFAYIQNITESPITLESITYKVVGEKANPYTLKSVDKRNLLFKKASVQTKKIEPSGFTLEPKQYLFIPIEFGFDTNASKKEFKTRSSIENSAILALPDKELYITKPLSKTTQLEASNSLTTQNKNITEPITLDKEFIAKSKKVTTLIELIPDRFAVGALIEIISLKINGQNINAELPPDKATSIYMSPNYQSGSCPFLLVYNSKKAYWLDMGTVLYGRNEKSLQHYEVHNIERNISKIKLEEREPEITYIDALSIIYTDRRTKTVREVIPPIPEIKKLDGDYLLLHQGEFIEIDFETLIPAQSSDLKLKINGYYEILLDDRALRPIAKRM